MNLTSKSAAPSPSARKTLADPVSNAKLLGNWQLDRPIGQGTYSTLFDARPLGCPPSWPADYVVKLPRPEFRYDPTALRTMQREAEVGRHTCHPNLVAILESHLESDLPHLVMPKLHGASLAEVIERVGPLVVPQALWITRQIAQAVHHLHQQGWIHGDVKPANIMVSRQGHATLIDLAFAMRASESLYSTSRPLATTLAYVAPEMLTSSTQTNPASDVYSLGVSLFQMLCGQLPFRESDPARLVEAHLRQAPPDLLDMECNVPEPLALLVKRMMSKIPLRRPRCGDELIGQLADLEIETMEGRLPRYDGAA